MIDIRIFKFNNFIIKLGVIEILDEEGKTIDLRRALKIQFNAQRKIYDDLQDDWNSTWYLILQDYDIKLVSYYSLKDRHIFHVYREEKIGKSLLKTMDKEFEQELKKFLGIPGCQGLGKILWMSKN
ncbi:MAG: hypothetical protein ACP5K8_08895 [Nitrososphaeria archaeon]